jgi:uncharacterized protein YfaQ (DUF2300 family)
MSSQQIVYCSACGAKMQRSFVACGYTFVCDRACYQELEWRRVLSILGKPYYSDPKGLDKFKPEGIVEV